MSNKYTELQDSNYLHNDKINILAIVFFFLLGKYIL